MPHTYEMYVTYWLMSIEQRFFLAAVIPEIYRRLDSSRVKKSRKDAKEAYVVFN